MQKIYYSLVSFLLDNFFISQQEVPFMKLLRTVKIHAKYAWKVIEVVLLTQIISGYLNYSSLCKTLSTFRLYFKTKLKAGYFTPSELCLNELALKFEAFTAAQPGSQLIALIGVFYLSKCLKISWYRCEIHKLTLLNYH